MVPHWNISKTKHEMMVYLVMVALALATVRCSVAPPAVATPSVATSGGIANQTAQNELLTSLLPPSTYASPSPSEQVFPDASLATPQPFLPAPGTAARSPMSPMTEASQSGQVFPDASLTTPQPFLPVPAPGVATTTVAPAQSPPEPMVMAAAVPQTQPGVNPDQGSSFVAADELPPGVSDLINGTGSSNIDNSTTQRPNQFAPQSSFASTLASRPPPPVIGTLTSLLNPPPGFIMPPLSDAQTANVPRLRQLRQGIATVAYMRAISNYDGTNMNCGLGYLNDFFKDHFVGLPKPMYRDGQLCGLCIRVWCVDSVCQSPLVTNTTYMVTDSCEDCKNNDIVVAARGTAGMTGIDYNINPSVQVAWEFTSCAPLIDGGIKLLPSDNNDESFVGLNFSNLKVLLKGVRINGMTMDSTTYGFWAIQEPGQKIPLRPPYVLELLGVDNQRLVVRIASLTAQDLGVNFKS